jgi:hypothetical protein
VVDVKPEMELTSTVAAPSLSVANEVEVQGSAGAGTGVESKKCVKEEAAAEQVKS